jgi:hypothetical protein
MSEQSVISETAAIRRRVKAAVGNSGANDPAEFQQLEPGEQAALLDWIRSVLVPAKAVFRRNSYGMKHDFEREPDGFYVRNGAFKGAMLAAGFPPVDERELNWDFRVRPARKLPEWEKDRLGLVGRGCLARDRSREKGYVVVGTAQHERLMGHWPPMLGGASPASCGGANSRDGEDHC